MKIRCFRTYLNGMLFVFGSSGDAGLDEAGHLWTAGPTPRSTGRCRLLQVLITRAPVTSPLLSLSWPKSVARLVGSHVSSLIEAFLGVLVGSEQRRGLR